MPAPNRVKPVPIPLSGGQWTVHRGGLIEETSSSSSKVRIWILTAAACLLIGVFFLLWRRTMPLEGLLRVFASRDAWDHARSLALNPKILEKYYSLSVGMVLATLGTFIVCAMVWARLSEATRELIFSLTLTLACSCALISYLLRLGYDSPWAPIKVLMSHPSALPVFGHRLLFVWVAKGFQKIVPRLSDLRGFYLSQCMAILLAVYALGRWSRLHIGKTLGWVGQILGILLISTAYGYYNFYDIAYVFFTTCGLCAIYTRKYWWLVPIVGIGTLNYEGVLLLIPVAAFVAYDQESVKRWLPALVVSLVMYGFVRFAMQWAIPMPRQVDWRIWSNMTQPFLLAKETAYCVLALGCWYALALMSFAGCDRRLLRMALLFPLVVAVTFLFGQMHEPRQFDAFIPILVAMVLVKLRQKFVVETRYMTASAGG